MAEAATTAPKAKPAKPAMAAFDMPKFEMPKFEMPKFDMPKVEMPAAFREMAERGVAQAKDTYEKMKAAAEEATDVLETTYSTATKGASDYGLKVIEAARANTNAAFDFAGEVMAAKTLSEVVELTNAHARKQFEVAVAAEQGTRCAGAEGCDRDGRADQERHEQGLYQGRLIASWIALFDYPRRTTGKSPGLARAFAYQPLLISLPKCGVPPSFRALTDRAGRAAVAQLVRAPDCGSGGRWFESTQLYQFHAPQAVVPAQPVYGRRIAAGDSFTPAVHARFTLTRWDYAEAKQP